ncbi:hypothetical protein INR49_031801 [Caranx melampygus]|nr:hypothetical protein INR49_031801 [Caranx melampygus]
MALSSERLSVFRRRIAVIQHRGHAQRYHGKCTIENTGGRHEQLNEPSQSRHDFILCTAVSEMQKSSLLQDSGYHLAVHRSSVNLWKLEQRPNVGSMLLRLDFNIDVAPRLLFLKEIGVEDSRLGYIITHNPFILTENVENLQTRVNYLKSKKFSSETVASMVSRAPFLLNFSVKRLDNRLGFYQQQLNLSTSNTLNLVARLPRLLCGSLEPVKETLKVCEIEFGFKKNEIQHIVIAVPKVLTANKRKLTQIFDFLHNTMKVPHHLITKFPQVLNAKYLRIRERHLFLEYLGKAQYDPSQPNYISLDRLVSLPDETFCTDLALSTLEDFYLFQKTL